MKRKILKISIVSLVLLTVVFFTWYYLIWDFTNNFPSEIENPNQITDAIIVLTGGSGRIDEGINLLNNGSGKKLFISGVAPTVQTNDLIVSKWENRDNLIKNTFLGKSARNTHENAVEINKWTSENNIKSVRIVTAYYHMPRSVLEISKTTKKLEIIMHPVFPEQLSAEWWFKPSTAILITEEYFKFIFSSFRSWI